MTKVRVFELAREMKVESKLLLARLKAAGIDLPSHQSSLTPEQVDLIKSGKLGHASAVSDPVKATAAGKPVAKPTVVLRRRRPQAEQETVEAAPEELAPPASTQEVEDDYEPLEQSVELKDQTFAPDEEKYADEVATSGSEIIEETQEVGIESKAIEKVEQYIEKDRKDASEAKEPPSRGIVQPQKQKTEKTVATIVRKAGPMDAPPTSTRPRDFPRRRETSVRPPAGDFRGERKPGFGPRPEQRSDRPERPGFQARSDRPPFGGRTPPPPVVVEDISTLQDADSGRPRRRDLKDSKKKAEDEEALLKSKARRQREEDSFNARALLSHLELKSIDTIEEEFVYTADDFQRKTVYTPTVSTKKKDIKRRKDLRKTQITTPRAAYRIVRMFGPTITVSELSKQLSVKATDLIKKLMSQGVMATINQSIDFDTTSLISHEYGYEVQISQKTEEDILGLSDEAKQNIPKTPRPPIVTVMGHVDHGKTSILDAIRKTHVAQGEAGGITQHIGAYSVGFNNKHITFLDTPGHEAFSSMRARGAKLTDLVVLVVAADDGVKKQTVEAISHAKEAEVPIIVAINKVDKPNLNFERIYTELSERGVQPEEWGGEIQVVKVSALAKTGINELLESILLQAEILELESSPSVPAEGVVVEAHLDKGRGPMATVMVTDGILRIGDYIVAGTKSGNVRAMLDHQGKTLNEASAAIPVQVLGLSGVPEAGDPVNTVSDEKIAKEVLDIRIANLKAANTVKSSAASLEDLLGKIRSAESAEVPIVLKADTQGSVEAIAESLIKCNTEKVSNRLIHKGAGGVTESDITLAAASGAVIIAFNVRAGRGLDEFAENQGVPIKYFSIIYEVVDTIKALMAGMLPPIVKEVVLGHAEVRVPINIPKIGMIAGSAVIDGKITRSSHCRLVRDSVVIYNGKLCSLKRFKDDVREVQTGYECGIGIEGYNDVHAGDVIEAYVLEETAQTL